MGMLAQSTTQRCHTLAPRNNAGCAALAMHKQLCGTDTFCYTLVPAVLVAVMLDLLVDTGQSDAFWKSTRLHCCSALVMTQAKHLV